MRRMTALLVGGATAAALALGGLVGGVLAESPFATPSSAAPVAGSPSPALADRVLTGAAGGVAAQTIARLEDENRDGRFEKRTVFADGLTFPNGVLPWNGGLIVTCAPDILFLKDTNGENSARYSATVAVRSFSYS